MSQWRRRYGAPVLDFAAGNGLINRRALLGSSLAAAGTVTGAAAEPLADDRLTVKSAEFQALAKVAVQP